jgi:hypothetical protein
MFQTYASTFRAGLFSNENVILIISVFVSIIINKCDRLQKLLWLRKNNGSAREEVPTEELPFLVNFNKFASLKFALKCFLLR